MVDARQLCSGLRRPPKCEREAHSNKPSSYILPSLHASSSCPPFQNSTVCTSSICLRLPSVPAPAPPFSSPPQHWCDRLPFFHDMTFGESDFCRRRCERRENECLPVLKIALIPEPLTPDNEYSERRSGFSLCVRGSLIHLSQSEDGKLMWLPPSSTASSSLTGDKELSGCLSESADVDGIGAANYSPACHSESSVTRLNSADLLCYEDPETSAEVRPVSTSSTIKREVDGGRKRELSEDRLGIPQSAEGSESSMQSHMMKDKRVMSLHKGLTPYLSSKLKPGKHVLGVKRNQAFIRPGQLRHWAVGNSPALTSSFVGLSSPSNKGNACRTLNF